jgi:hypothetical protein
MIRVIAAFSLNPIAAQIVKAVRTQDNLSHHGISLIPYSVFGIDESKLASQANNVQLLLKLCTLLYMKGCQRCFYPRA